jgi:hypothetical protein
LNLSRENQVFTKFVFSHAACSAYASGKVVEATVKTVFMRKSLKGGLQGALENFDIVGAVGAVGVAAVGRCTLTPPDPQLRGTWYPGGFSPCAYQAKNRFQNVPFKFNLRRYTALAAKVVTGGGVDGILAAF